MQTDFHTISLEVFLERLRDSAREVIGASLELKIRATLVVNILAMVH
jgi:hypothetical protein